MGNIGRVAFETLGCKLSYAETMSYCRDFEANGCKQVSPRQQADIVVVNTCSVTEHADKKCRNYIRRLNRLSPDARIVVTGCYAQLAAEEISKMDGVWCVVGSAYKSRLVTLALSPSLDRKVFVNPSEEDSGFFPAWSSGERTRSFLKVQDGCDYHCTYCTVPLARGGSRNGTIASIVEQARQAAAQGVSEIVLTGVNTGDFGKTTGESFLDLLKALQEVEGISRYRISSIEPNLLTDEIIEWIASGTKFLPHFHIPLQSGCNKILKAMHRRYNTEFFSKKIAKIRSHIDNVFLGIDVIVGFPGETDEDFQETYSFLETIRPAFIHIFPYSRRKNTPAASLPEQVQESVKSCRVARLEELCGRLHADFVEENRGRREEVLFESSNKGGKMFGYTRNYIRVERDFDPETIGKTVWVTL